VQVLLCGSRQAGCILAGAHEYGHTAVAAGHFSLASKYVVHSDHHEKRLLTFGASEYLMVQHYWNHVEFFPMHIALPASVKGELITILCHAAVGDFGTISAVWIDLD
jgi:hypothetical protein